MSVPMIPHNEEVTVAFVHGNHPDQLDILSMYVSISQLSQPHDHLPPALECAVDRPQLLVRDQQLDVEGMRLLPRQIQIHLGARICHGGGEAAKQYGLQPCLPFDRVLDQQ